MQHHVRQAKFDLKCEHKHANTSVRRQWQKIFLQSIAPLVDQALSEWEKAQAKDHSQDTLAINRLTLDMGEFPVTEFNSGLSATFDRDLLIKHFKRQIAEQLTDTPRQYYPQHEWQLECYLHFLLLGYWPTGSEISKLSQIEDFYQQAEKQHLEQLLARLQNHFSNPHLLSRMAYQHSKQFNDYLAKQKVGRVDFYKIQKLAERYMKDSSYYGVCGLVFAFFIEKAKKEGMSFPAALKSLQNLLQTNTVKRATECSLPVLLDKLQTLSKLANDVRREQITQEPLKDLANKNHNTENENTNVQSTLVTNAGLILLHPFLNELFNQCGWLVAEQFVSEQAKLDAMFALHYAATGECSAQENELLLHKFLLGISITKPVPAHRMLDDDIKNQVDTMLSAVIDHWSALKNTSIEGLRQAFLQRAGSLQTLDEGYRLTVEKQTIDILLQRLPWRFDLVVLPWLKQPIFVTWAES